MTQNKKTTANLSPHKSAGNSARKASPVFYDCEASGLENGFPIEVGWAFIDATGTMQSEAHLIRPSPEWNIAETWDMNAERVHGISLEHLRKHGQSAYTVASRMNTALADREVFSDSTSDEFWLRQLFDAAGIDPVFLIRRMSADILIDKLAQDRGMSTEAYTAAKQGTEQLAPRTHRADADARHLATLWQMVAEQR